MKKSYPQFHTDPLSSTHRFPTRTAQFHTRNPSVPHQKPLSSTHWTYGVELRGVWYWEVFGVELRGVLNWGLFGIEPRGFRCGTEGFLVWNWGVCWAEGFSVWNWGISGAEKVWFMGEFWNIFFKLIKFSSLISGYYYQFAGYDYFPDGYCCRSLRASSYSQNNGYVEF